MGALSVLKKLLAWDMVTLILFIVIIPIILGGNYFFDTVNLVGIYVIAVIGLNLILGVAGLISLGHAASFGLGAYISAYISIHYPINPFLSIIMSCILVALIIFIISFPLLRLSGYFLALGTLAICVVCYSLINGAGDITGGPNGLIGIPSLSIGSFEFSSATEYFYLIWLTVLVIYMLAKNLINSREGRALKAIHSDESAAASFGIDVFRFKMKIFVYGSGLGALAGGYYAHYMAFISPDIVSLNSSINILSMAFLGGLGSYMGPIFGSILFQLIPELSSFAKEYELFIHGVIFLCVVIFLRGGVQSVIDRSVLIFKHRKTK
jgi:branched-chain amino acid transport system permease protein